MKCRKCGQEIDSDATQRISLNGWAEHIGGSSSAPYGSQLGCPAPEPIIGYAYYPGEALTALDLREEMTAALERGDEGIETAIIVQADEATGGLLLNNNERGQALYIHSLGRIGIAWGAYADWADAESLAEGIRTYTTQIKEGGE